MRVVERGSAPPAIGVQIGAPPALPLRVRAYLDQMQAILAQVDEAQLASCLEVLWKAWEEDRTVFIVGNGGSASTASHMACDLSKQTQLPGRKPLRAHSLTDNVALISAFGNDIEYSRIFAEQLRIHARPGDLLVCISCSGNSPNVVGAVHQARSLGLTVLAFGGTSGGSMARLADLYVHVPSDDYGVIESAHLVFDHCLANLLFEYGKNSISLRPVVLVDRDGVIVRNRDDYVRSWNEIEFLPGALGALAKLSKRGYRVLVVTNQSVVGRGLLPPEELEAIHHRLAGAVAVEGGHLEAFLVCPHRPQDGCACRKPAPGLLHQARDRFNIDLESAYFIGDWETDMEAARAAGCSGILVLSGRASEDGSASRADHVVADLAAAVDLILAEQGGSHSSDLEIIAEVQAKSQAAAVGNGMRPASPTTREMSTKPNGKAVPTVFTAPPGPSPNRPWYEFNKRVLDVVTAAGALVLLSPIWLLIAIAIKLTSPGPALYRGMVMGRGGQPFTYYKFRSMRAGDDAHHRAWIKEFVTRDAPYQGSVYKAVDDPRRTAVGRFIRRLSLDEVPQLINVLRGDMSIVGPRPPLPFEYTLYDEVARRRLTIKPGITGLYQVTARSAVPFSEMLAIDLEYIRRRSTWLDLRIMLRTITAMISGKGAN